MRSRVTSPIIVFMREFDPTLGSNLPPEMKISIIKMVVNKVRERTGIEPTPGNKREGSCFGARGGEWGNLFRAQLLNTTEDTGEWSTLKDPEILGPLFDYVVSEYLLPPNNPNE